MKKRLFSAALLLVAVPLAAQTARPAKKAAPRKPAAKAAPEAAKPAAPALPEELAGSLAALPKEQNWLDIDGLFQKDLKVGDIEVKTPISGVTTAQDTYDIFAPFDGRVEDMQSDLFQRVTPQTEICRMVSTEMAALLDASSEEERRQTERRWKDVYQHHPIKPEAAGILTNIYVQPHTRVLRGDRLFTVARKVVLIGKNTQPLYSKLAKGMPAVIENRRDRDEKYPAVLSDFVVYKSSPLFNRLWLEVPDTKEGIRIGEPYEGELTVGRSSKAMLLPREELLEHGGRRFMLVEIKTGLETGEELEILDRTPVYLAPARRKEDGKKQKER